MLPGIIPAVITCPGEIQIKGNQITGEIQIIQVRGESDKETRIYGASVWIETTPVWIETNLITNLNLIKHLSGGLRPDGNTIISSDIEVPRKSQLQSCGINPFQDPPVEYWRRFE